MDSLSVSIIRDGKSEGKREGKREGKKEGKREKGKEKKGKGRVKEGKAWFLRERLGKNLIKNASFSGVLR